ncbi:MAG: hypothetical protein ACOC1P_03090 [Minisyncoccales bacterium]
MKIKNEKGEEIEVFTQEDLDKKLEENTKKVTEEFDGKFNKLLEDFDKFKEENKKPTDPEPKEDPEPKGDDAIKEKERKEVLPECFIEKKSFLNVIEDFLEEEKEVFILDEKGQDIRDVEIPENSVFIIGDHKGLPKKEMKRISNKIKKVSIGPKTYFASQTVAILNNELDRKGF